MLSLIRDNYIFYLLFLPVYIGSSFIVSSAPLAVGLAGIAWFLAAKRYDYLIILFFLTLILANNRAPNFDSYKMLRVAFLGVLFFLSVLVIFKEKGVDRRIMYFMPFLGIALVSSVLFSPFVINSVFKVLSYLVLVGSLFSLVKNMFKVTERNLYEHLLILILIVLGISLMGNFVYPNLFKVSGRLNGVLGNPNFLGLFCVMAYAIVDHFKVEESAFTKREVWVLKGIIILCLFLTGSRNAYASLGLYIILTVTIFRGFSGKYVAVVLGVGAIIAFLQLDVITRNIPYLSQLLRPETLQSGSGRSTVWPIAIEEIFRQPWLGGGFEYYSYYMSGYATMHDLKGVMYYGVWNTYLAFMLDTGVLGLLAYLFFIFGLSRLSAKFLIILPFLVMVAFTCMFEAWTVSSLNPITPFFLLFFVIISTRGSRYEDISIA